MTVLHDFVVVHPAKPVGYCASAMADIGQDDVLYVPARPADRGADVALELRRTPDGAIVAFAFSSPAALTRGCGVAQPYVLIQRNALADFLAAAGVRRVLVDARLDRSLWAWRQGQQGPEPLEETA